MASLTEAGFGLVARDDKGRDWGRAEQRSAIRKLAAAYWAAVFVSTSVLWGIAGTDPVESAPGKLASIAFALLLTTGMTWLLKRTLARPLWQQAAAAFGLSLLAAPVSARQPTRVFWVLFPSSQYPPSASRYPAALELSAQELWAGLEVASVLVDRS